MEDNDSAIKAVAKGYSSALRSLYRTHRVHIGRLHEIFHEFEPEAGEGTYTITHAPAKTHKGDVFTKPMGPNPFLDALARLGLFFGDPR